MSQTTRAPILPEGRAIVRNSMSRLWISVVLLVAAGRLARADCAQDAAEIRGQLAHDAAVAHRWNLGWSLGFTAAAVVQLGAAPTGWFGHELTSGLWINGGKAAIAAAFRWATPLRISVPAERADACADRDALRAALAEAGRAERLTFWMTHVGGFALNLAGALILWREVSWQAGAESFAISYPVGLANAYTQPRGAWHRWRDTRDAWAPTVSVIARRDGAFVSLSSSF